MHHINQTTMTKKNLIKKIKSIIAEYGTFGIGEVQADCSPCIASNGNIVSLAEGFEHDVVEVESYNAKHSSDSIDSYTEPYENLSKEVLNEILKLAMDWEVQNLQDEDRLGNPKHPKWK